MQDHQVGFLHKREGSLVKPLTDAKDKKPMSTSNYVTAALSLVALSVSFYTLWKSHLRPFNLAVWDVGRVAPAITEFNPSGEPVLCAEFIFSNHGARSGVIRNASLEVTFPDGRNVLFTAEFLLMKDPMLMRNKDAQPEVGSFVAFLLKGGDTVVRYILFFLYRPDLYYEFPVGLYRARLRVLTDKNDKWKSWKPFTFVIDKKDLEVLNKHKSEKKWCWQSKRTEEREATLKQLNSEIQ